MENFIVGGILVILVGIAIYAMWKAKKKGAHCIGCPSAGSCPAKCSCCEKGNSK
ncbi:MAG: FeoB-associated Cys-rich membrane protein [Eubacterium sp.]|nr:FeoB-associated Cys-rich membrane protein [Eubacterium sp.]